MAKLTSLILLLITSALLIFLQTYPYITNLKDAPKDRVYLGAERYYPDYYAYLFYVNQGNTGASIVQNLFTNEPHADTYVHFEYVIIGKIGSLLKINPIQTLFLARSILLLLFIFISFIFTGLFIRKPIHRILILTLSFFYNGFFFLDISDFYEPPDLINRLTFEPHKFIGMSLFLIALYSISKKRLFVSALTCLTIGLFHGASAISMIATLGLFLFLLLISHPFKLRKFILENIIIFLPLLLLPIPLIYWNDVFTNNPVWQYMDQWEKYAVLSDIKKFSISSIASYLSQLGPLIILSALGLKSFLKENKKTGLLLLSFYISNFLLLFLGFIILKTSKIRYFQTPYLLALSIMAYYGILSILKKIRFKRLDLGLFITIVLLLSLGIPNIRTGILKYIYPYKTQYTNEISVYPTKTLYNAILWLNSTPQESIVLSLSKAGLLIPATPGRRVVASDIVSSYNYLLKLPKIYDFYRGGMPENKAKEYLKQERVNYIFYGPEEKSVGNLDKYSSFITQVFSNSEASIYKVGLSK